MIRIIVDKGRTVDDEVRPRPHPTIWTAETEDGELILTKPHQPFVAAAAS